METPSVAVECLPSLYAGWLPEPRISVSDWADAERRIGTKAGRAASRWSTATTPYLREIMDALGPRSPYRIVVFEKGSQIGGTEAGNNWLGFLMSRSPCPILVLRPTVDEARRFSRQRLVPMIDETPELAGLVQPARSREGGNTLLMKEFPGGVLFLVGSNSATGVKSMPILCLFCDEVDEYPGDVDGQGDPISLAEKRMAGPTFGRRKEFLVGTPTIKHVSRIEAEYKKTDQRRYYVPCPFCGNYDWIRWENIRYQLDENHELIPKSVALACVSCGTLIEERYKLEMLPAGEWRATADGPSDRIGFHLSSLYSPFGWFPWTAAVKEWLEAQSDPMKLKAFVNTVLGDTWEERGDTVEPETLLARTEQYPAAVPVGVGVLVASVDVQDDRLECLVKGYGAGEESWLIDYAILHGDPATEALWLDLDAFLLGTYKHASGRNVPISCTAVDTGGHFTEQVYRFCKARIRRRVFAIKGGSKKGEPVVGRPSVNNAYRVKLFVLCVDTAKGAIYARLKIGEPGPGYIHFPVADFIDDEYFAQLTAEKAVRKWVKNRGVVRHWIKIRARNEALDLEVYALAALYILGQTFVKSLPERAAALARPAALAADVEVVERTGPAMLKPRGYIDGYKG
jgi:phage terminase large subunit GpA-like protein